MIGFLSGVVRFADLDAVCIDVGGVGYRVLMPLPDLARHNNVGAKIEAFIHTHVREDAITLFGFSTRDGLGLFERLIAVSGVGPRTGLAILSGVEVGDLMRAIASGDEARLTKVPGVGKKTAARLVLELQDKMMKEGVSASTGGKLAKGSALDDLRSALLNLGYKPVQIDRAVTKVKPLADEGRGLEELVREALRHVA
jgi:Holliday junction DNA helicase RuvA